MVRQIIIEDSQVLLEEAEIAGWLSVIRLYKAQKRLVIIYVVTVVLLMFFLMDESAYPLKRMQLDWNVLLTCDCEEIRKIAKEHVNH